MRQRLVFSLEQLRRAPARYRFFAIDETVWFGDEAQTERFNADGRYAERHELHAWPISHGDFEDARTARWIAERLNHDPASSAFQLSRLRSSVANVIAIARKELGR